MQQRAGEAREVVEAFEAAVDRGDDPFGPCAPRKRVFLAVLHGAGIRRYEEGLLHRPRARLLPVVHERLL
ncbi:hypothetical protein [Streptomyces sp. NRRL F-2305]|uniref:hypothetical protein n=1 Tax=Streptomyces sp. NRRL F-2305 TaxID=1463840 RepID=UPI0018FE957D|nr:hypothetical protein [Streptomyces sp. NRRL F-2305]